MHTTHLFRLGVLARFAASFGSFGRALFLPAFALALSTSSALQAAEPDELETIKANFDTLSASVTQLKESTANINTRLGLCANYLDTMGASPVQVAGKDLASVAAGAQNLAYEDWTNLATANKSSITDLMLRDSAVRQTMIDIKTEVVAITDELNRLKPQSELIQVQAGTLGTQLKAYMKENKWKVLQLTPLMVKIGNVGKDSVGLLQEAQKTLGQSGAVLTKLGVATSLLPPEDPLLADLAKIEAMPATLPNAEGDGTADADPAAIVAALTGTTVAAPGTGADATVADIEGFWQEAGTQADRLRLLLGKQRVGQPSGYAILPGGEIQTTLLFVERQGDRSIYKESRDGFRYEVALDGGELSLRHTQPDGGTAFRVFLTRR